MYVCESHSVVSDSATPWTVVCQAPPFMDFCRQEYWSGFPFPSPGDLPDPGLEPRYPHCRQTFSHLSHQGSPPQFLVLKFLQMMRNISTIKAAEVQVAGQIDSGVQCWIPPGGDGQCPEIVTLIALLFLIQWHHPSWIVYFLLQENNDPFIFLIQN